MPDFLPIALLALAAGDSLPPALRPLYSVDDGARAWTVAQAYQDTLHAWRLGPGVTVEAVIETPGEGEVPVLFVPRAGEDTSTGVNELPPADQQASEGSDESAGGTGSAGTACGRLFSIEWR